jgi:hypothetical protein
MNETTIHIPARTAETPEDLRLFLERIAALGVRVSLPTAGPADPLADPVEIGTGLSDAVIRLRADG